LQLAASLPSASLPAEVSGFLQFRDEYVFEPLRVKDGGVDLPQSAGFASLIDWEKLVRLRP